MGRFNAGSVQMVATGVLLAGLAAFAMIHFAPPPAPASLCEPIENRDVAAVKNALARHADVNELDGSGFTPLHLAVSQNNVEIIELLLKAGADVRQVDRSGLDALSEAVMCNRPEIVKLLLDHGAPVNNPARQRGLVGTAAVMSPASLQMLLDAGANPNEQWPDRPSALQIAINAESPEAIRALLAAGATPVKVEHPEAVATTEHSPQLATHRAVRGNFFSHELRVMNGMRRPFPARPLIAGGVARIFPLPRPRPS